MWVLRRSSVNVHSPREPVSKDVAQRLEQRSIESRTAICSYLRRVRAKPLVRLSQTHLRSKLHCTLQLGARIGLQRLANENVTWLIGELSQGCIVREFVQRSIRLHVEEQPLQQARGNILNICETSVNLPTIHAALLDVGCWNAQKNHCGGKYFDRLCFGGFTKLSQNL